MRTLKLLILFAAGSLVLVPTARAQSTGGGSITPVARVENARETPALSSAEIQIRPGDLIRVRVWPDSSLSGEFSVDGTGHLHLPLLGRVSVAGRPVSSIAEEIRLGYSVELKNPVVMVTPVMRVSVLGAVKAPGLYQVDPSFSVLDVISLAGGFTGAAKEHRVRLVRGGEATVVDAREALSTGSTAGEMTVRSGDRIVVPDRSGWLTFQNAYFVLQAALGVVTLVNVMN